MKIEYAITDLTEIIDLAREARRDLSQKVPHLEEALIRLNRIEVCAVRSREVVTLCKSSD